MRALFVVLMIAGPALADSASTAREHYKSGMKAYDLGHYADAAKEFEAAYSAQDEPALLFNLGQAYRFNSDYSSAIRSYRSFLRRMPHAANRTEVEARIAELQKLVEEQNRQRDKPPAGAIAPPNEPLPPPILEAAKPPAAPRAWAPARPLKIAGLTLIGVGAASLILGGVFTSLASSAADKVNSPANGVFDPAQEDRMNLYQNLDVAFFVSGGVLVAGGLAAFLIGQLHKSNVEVTPIAGPNRAGASLQVHFQ